MKTFLIRLLSGFIYVVLILGSVFLGPVFFGFVLLVFLVIGLLEVYEISKIPGCSMQRGTLLVTGLLVFSLSILVIWDYFPVIFLVFNLGIISIPFILELFRKVKDPFQNLGFYLIAIYYLVIPMVILNVLFFPGLNFQLPSNFLLLGFFILIWVNDTFAYLSGMLLGKHKFYERISPNKTWEGTIGGAVFTMIGAYVFSLIFHEFTELEWMGLGFVIVIFGTFGDLVESMLKRSYGIKDSGKIMPGHGGMLDRLDSILIAAPFVLLYVVLILN